MCEYDVLFNISQGENIVFDGEYYGCDICLPIYMKSYDHLFSQKVSQLKDVNIWLGVHCHCRDLGLSIHMGFYDHLFSQMVSRLKNVNSLARCSLPSVVNIGLPIHM